MFRIFNKQTKIFIWIGILFFILEVSALASNYYFVAPYGNDNWNGSLSKPWRTITHAVEKAVGQDARIYVLPGTYDVSAGEQFPIVIDRTDMLVQGYGDEPVIVDTSLWNWACGADCWITLNNASYTLSTVGPPNCPPKTVDLNIVDTCKCDKNLTYTWTSSNPAAATVDPSTGIVSAVAPGVTEVSVTCPTDSTCKGICNIEVVSCGGACTITVTPTTATIYIPSGEGCPGTVDLNATVANCGTVEWSSDHREIADVDQTGLVTAVSVSTIQVTITARCSLDPTICFATSKVTVKDIADCGGCTIDVTPATASLSYPGGGFCDPTSKKLTATPTGCSGTVVWSSDNEAVATVDQTGIVTAISSNETPTVVNIKAECSADATCYDTCVITVKKCSGIQLEFENQESTEESNSGDFTETETNDVPKATETSAFEVANNSSLKNLIIKGAATENDDVSGVKCSGTTALDNLFIEGFTHGIKCVSHTGSITHCEILSNLQHGIYFPEVSGSTIGTDISNCAIYLNGKSGILLDKVTEDSANKMDFINNVILKNNPSDNSYNGGIFCINTDTIPSNPNEIRNNIIVYNGGSGLGFAQTPTGGSHNHYNDLWSNSADYKNCIPDDTEISEDPLLIGLGTSNYVDPNELADLSAHWLPNDLVRKRIIPDLDEPDTYFNIVGNEVDYLRTVTNMTESGRSGDTYLINDFHLQELKNGWVTTSPCFDSGDPLVTDRDGSRSDMGLFGGLDAYWKIYVSINGNDISGDGSYGLPYRTISKAVQVANIGDTIIVGEGEFVESVTLEGTDKAITIQGAGANKTILNGKNNYPQVVHFDNIPVGSVAGIKDMTIKGSKKQSGETTCGNNAGIWCDNCAPVIERCIITDNYNGIYCSSDSTLDVPPTPIISYCELINNQLTGLCCERSSPYVQNCLIAYNSHGIYSDALSYPDLGGGLFDSLGDNDIVDNEFYSFYNEGPKINAKNNWWGTLSASIIQSKLYNVEFQPFKNSVWGSVTIDYENSPVSGFELLYDYETTFSKSIAFGQAPDSTGKWHSAYWKSSGSSDTYLSLTNVGSIVNSDVTVKLYDASGHLLGLVSDVLPPRATLSVSAAEQIGMISSRNSNSLEILPAPLKDEKNPAGYEVTIGEGTIDVYVYGGGQLSGISMMFYNKEKYGITYPLPPLEDSPLSFFQIPNWYVSKIYYEHSEAIGWDTYLFLSNVTDQSCTAEVIFKDPYGDEVFSINGEYYPYELYVIAASSYLEDALIYKEPTSYKLKPDYQNLNPPFKVSSEPFLNGSGTIEIDTIGGQVSGYLNLLYKENQTGNVWNLPISSENEPDLVMVPVWQSDAYWDSFLTLTNPGFSIVNAYLTIRNESGSILNALDLGLFGHASYRIKLSSLKDSGSDYYLEDIPLNAQDNQPLDWILADDNEPVFTTGLIQIYFNGASVSGSVDCRKIQTTDNKNGYIIPILVENFSSAEGTVYGSWVYGDKWRTTFYASNGEDDLTWMTIVFYDEFGRIITEFTELLGSHQSRSWTW